MEVALQNIVEWILNYKYFIILPFAVIEGPIITIISGFLSSIGYLNLWIAYPIVVLGDLIGDSLYYLIGLKGGRPIIKKYGKYIGVTLDNLEQMEVYFSKHRQKTLLFGKFVHGTGSLMWVASGIARMPYGIFLLTNFYTTLIKSFILILIGFYFGKAYVTINNYFNYIAFFASVLLIISYILIIKTNLLTRYFKSDDETKKTT